MARIDYITVTQAAADLQRSTSRVRSLCIANGIGTKVANARLLTAADVKRLRSILAAFAKQSAGK